MAKTKDEIKQKIGHVETQEDGSTQPSTTPNADVEKISLLEEIRDLLADIEENTRKQ